MEWRSALAFFRTGRRTRYSLSNGLLRGDRHESARLSSTMDRPRSGHGSYLCLDRRKRLAGSGARIYVDAKKKIGDGWLGGKGKGQGQSAGRWEGAARAWRDGECSTQPRWPHPTGVYGVLQQHMTWLACWVSRVLKDCGTRSVPLLVLARRGHFGTNQLSRDPRPARRLTQHSLCLPRVGAGDGSPHAELLVLHRPQRTRPGHPAHAPLEHQVRGACGCGARQQ
eukprot:scaffold2063_cov114-Isochrysis_galbana.AAC.1